ncbi:TonB-dependent receptor [Pelomonas sp. KK5]|uniref:TonB-dependent receptor n=1 Tax=Pelomonas sp. KK5 TaxID=1855730 RepID=UPI00097C48BD|nr:TonB-dependent receptor [Pelomonas sp. KK5]
MNFRPTPLAAAVASLCLLHLAPARAADDAGKMLETVTVTGIRASIEKSMATKRNADTNIEAVSAEDVGKMPDKNIADALSRLPGVNVQYGGALAMDEAERVAIRGTSPNLNFVTINGHSLSAGDWHLGDQAGSGRSVGFGLMPSQLIGQTIVYKTGRADVPEGGISGSVDIITRRPLDFAKSMNGEISVGAAHATLANKTDPQVSGLFAWKNDAKTFGVLVQAFKEDRHLRRDGQEVFGYNVLSTAQATAAGHPELAGKRMSSSFNAAMFEGVRKRSGGFLDVQFRPSQSVELNLTAFKDQLKADNYNSSAYAQPYLLATSGDYQIVNPVVDGNVITSAQLVRNATTTKQSVGVEFDHFMRQGAKSTSQFFDLDGKWAATDNLTFKGRVGSTKGEGLTNSEPSMVFGLMNPAQMTFSQSAGLPASYAVLDAAGKPIDQGNVSNFQLMTALAPAVTSIDKESYGHVDGEWKLNFKVFTALKFGVRYTQHERSYDRWEGRYNVQDQAGGPNPPFTSVNGGVLVGNAIPVSAQPVPATSYPSNWFSGGDANIPRSFFRYDTAQLQAWAAANVNWDRTANHNWTSGFHIKEDNTAAYAMSEFELSPEVGGNVGLRYVETKLESTSYQNISTTCPALQTCSVPGAIVGSRLGTYVPQTVNAKQRDWLPSLNLRWDVSKDVVARAALTRSLGRANYNELAGAVILDDIRATGSSGNPNLKPITSTNGDLTFAWYFAPRAMLSGGVFTQRVQNYVKAGTSQVDFFNITQGKVTSYTVTSRKGVKATINGLEAAVELPIAGGFGVGANYTYVDSKDVDGVPLLGTSKNTYNLRGYYEDDKFSASLAWNYRSSYGYALLGDGTNTILRDANGVPTQYNGLNQYAGYGAVSLSLGYKITPNLSVHFDGNNLNDPIRHTYYITENATGYFHQNGRQYFLALRMKF